MKMSSSDEELDATSEKFNPLKALYSKNIKLPVQNVKRMDNVSIFESRIKRAGGSLDVDLAKVVKHIKKQDDKQEMIDKEKYHVTAMGRKFLLDQAPVKRAKPARFTKNLLTRMKDAKGPIALLLKFKENRIRVKVYTRKEHGIRGYITGFIEAFDKHFNLALIDCIEVWKRRKFQYSENKIPCLGQPTDCSKFLKKLGIKVPELTVKSLDRKNVQCTRKVQQLMIRGEEVVLIGEDNSTDELKDRMNILKV